MNHDFEPATVVVFAKAPRKGEVKTRLAAELGDEQALRAYQCFVDDVAEMVGRLGTALAQPVSAVLAYTGDPDHQGFEAFREAGFDFVEQGEGDLGRRLTQVTEGCFESGAERLVIIGTDSPTLSSRHFLLALSALEENDVVVGPSFDGGYYLIGLRAAHTEVFSEIDWSTERVFGQTMRRCRQSSLLCEALEFWYDVDTFDDLKLLETHLFDYLRYREPEIASRTAEFITELGDRGVFTGPPTENG